MIYKIIKNLILQMKNSYRNNNSKLIVNYNEKIITAINFLFKEGLISGFDIYLKKNKLFIIIHLKINTTVAFYKRIAMTKQSKLLTSKNVNFITKNYNIIALNKNNKNLAELKIFDARLSTAQLLCFLR